MPPVTGRSPGAKTNGGLLDLSDKLETSVQRAGEHAESVTKKFDVVSETYLGPRFFGLYRIAGEDTLTTQLAVASPDGTFMHTLYELDDAHGKATGTRNSIEDRANAKRKDVVGLLLT